MLMTARSLGGIHYASLEETPNGDTSEIQLGTDIKGKPVRKTGTQSYRSKGVTA